MDNTYRMLKILTSITFCLSLIKFIKKALNVAIGLIMFTFPFLSASFLRQNSLEVVISIGMHLVSKNSFSNSVI